MAAETAVTKRLLQPSRLHSTMVCWKFASPSKDDNLGNPLENNGHFRQFRHEILQAFLPLYQWLHQNSSISRSIVCPCRASSTTACHIGCHRCIGSAQHTNGLASCSKMGRIYLGLNFERFKVACFCLFKSQSHTLFESKILSHPISIYHTLGVFIVRRKSLRSEWQVRQTLVIGI